MEIPDQKNRDSGKSRKTKKNDNILGANTSKASIIKAVGVQEGSARKSGGAVSTGNSKIIADPGKTGNSALPLIREMKSHSLQ